VGERFRADVSRRGCPGCGSSAGIDDMNKSKGQSFIALCMLGLALFNYPILALFNVDGYVFGVPLLYAYVFVAWAVLIALMAWVTESDE
jgi:hypothetical protein